MCLKLPVNMRYILSLAHQSGSLYYCLLEKYRLSFPVERNTIEETQVLSETVGETDKVGVS